MSRENILDPLAKVDSHDTVNLPTNNSYDLRAPNACVLMGTAHEYNVRNS